MTIARDLQILNKGIKAIGVKLDKLLAVVEKSEKPKVARKAVTKKAAASPAKAKAVKKAPAKKAPAVKAATKKKAAQPTATDQVLKIINRSKKGVGVVALMEKTGFNQKKVYNIVHKISKLGKVKSAGKGIYVGA
jgi:Replication protein A C terminal